VTRRATTGADGIVRPAGAPRIRHIPIPTLNEALIATCDFRKLDDKGRARPIDPPNEIVKSSPLPTNADEVPIICWQVARSYTHVLHTDPETRILLLAGSTLRFLPAAHAAALAADHTFAKDEDRRAYGMLRLDLEQHEDLFEAIRAAMREAEEELEPVKASALKAAIAQGRERETIFRSVADTSKAYEMFH
jgi:hypothetical protein